MINALEKGKVSLKSVEQKLSITRIVEYRESHLKVHAQEVCRRCARRVCIHVCPADTYSYDEERGLSISYENCLECGSCKIVCELDNIDWSYPHGNFGVDFKWG